MFLLKPLFFILIAFGGLATLTGCQTVSYYSQAARGQLQVLTQRESIEDLLQDTNTPPSLRRKLETILEIRKFASTELHLPVDKQYLSYVDLKRRYAVWNVHAAPEFSLEAKSWWYPIVGRLKYRGFFAEENAHRYATNLFHEGSEVYVEGVEAYSTLGWFNDPVMSSFIDRSDVGLADILFHELAHQRLFINGDTDVDEAFATAVAAVGVSRWLLSTGHAETHARYQKAKERNRQFLSLVTQARSELELLYESDLCSPENISSEPGLRTARAAKQAIHDQLRERYQSLKSEWGGYDGYDRWLNKSLNNAQLNTVDSYYRLVPPLNILLQECEGDLETFYQRVEALADLSKEERHRYLESLVTKSDN